MVRKRGFEPRPPCEDQLLRLARLPFRHFRTGESIQYTSTADARTTRRACLRSLPSFARGLLLSFHLSDLHPQLSAVPSLVVFVDAVADEQTKLAVRAVQSRQLAFPSQVVFIRV